MVQRGRSPRQPSGKVKPQPEIADPDERRQIRDEALSSGRQFLLRDLAAAHALHLQAREDDPPGKTAHAFRALALCAFAAVEELDASRQVRGLPPIDDYATGLSPYQCINVPVWAAVALASGWMRATLGEPTGKGDAASKPPPSGRLPFIEAFRLGAGGGDRTVAMSLLNEQRDLDLAIAVEHAKRQAPPGRSDKAVLAAAAEKFGMSSSTAARAWKRHEAGARSVLDLASSKSVSKSGS